MEPDGLSRRALGSVIRELRVEREMTQTQVGERAALTQQEISNIEQGKRKPRDLRGLADALGVDFHLLVQRLKDRGGLVVAIWLTVVTAAPALTSQYNILEYNS